MTGLIRTSVFGALTIFFQKMGGVFLGVTFHFTFQLTRVPITFASLTTKKASKKSQN